MYKNTDMSVADMALELAELDYHTLTTEYLLGLAQKKLDEHWLGQAEKNPEYVLKTYELEIGRHQP